MKARKRNIISFAICALFVAGLLAGSCYIKEGKQNAVVPVSGHESTEQGSVIWSYETEAGNSKSPALNVRIDSVYQDGKPSKKITENIVIPDKVPECDEDGNVIAYHKVESIGKLKVSDEDSFFYASNGSFNVTSSGIVVDATACTGLKTVNDWAFSADGYGSEDEGYDGKVYIYLPDSLEKIETNCLQLSKYYIGRNR